MESWCVGVIITKAEDRRLDREGLGRKMPDGWDEVDIWARYKAAGIAIAEGEAPNR